MQVEIRCALRCKPVAVSPIRRASTKYIVLVLCATVAFACAVPGAKQPNDASIRVSVTPGASEEQLRCEYCLLFEYLADATGRTIEPVFYPTYGEVLDAFITGDLDLALLGGYAFVLAQAKGHVESLVMRDIDTRFTTYFIAKSDTQHHVIEDFQGEVFAFGSELSTSGHLMPRQFLKKRSIVPETFFGAVRYSGKHDATIHWVRDGEAALGAVSAVVFERMIADGQIQREQFEIVSQTPRYANYVWAIRPEVDESTKHALTDAFLDLIPQKSPGREILAKLRAEYFLSARASDFEPLARIVEELGLLGHGPET